MATRSSSGDSENDHSFAVRLMRHMVVPTFVLDAQHRVIIWNNACERLTGVAAAEVMGTRDHWRGFYDSPRPCLADLVLSGDMDTVDALYSIHSDTANTSFGLSAENWCVMPQIGSRHYLAIDAGRIYDEAGQLIAVIETLRDITAQKNAEMALQQVAMMDGLTGIANRRSFDEVLEREWRRSQRAGEPIGLLFCDVDYFKRYNDTYGHQRGDDCLRAVATAIKICLFRPGDAVARYGGEEFAIILPLSDLGASENIAKRVLECVRQLRLPHSTSEVSQHVTISIGVASMTPNPTNRSAQLLEAADRALYGAKGDGRNRYKLAD